MKKVELIEKIAEQTNTDKKTVQSILDSSFNIIADTIKTQEPVDIYGFGKFEGVFKGSHTAKNPKTGEMITVAPKNVPKFKPSNRLKKYLNA